MTSTVALFPGNGRFDGIDTEILNPALVETIKRASSNLGYDLIPAVRGETEEGVQPAIVALSVGIYRNTTLEDGFEPDVFLGHSLGEYSALVASGVLDLSDAVRIVSQRESLMSEVEGKMVAVVGPSSQEVEDACRGVEKVYPANYNLPNQTVISGRSEAVERVKSDFDRARFFDLGIGSPSHTPLMEDAASKLRKKLEDVDFSQSSEPVRVYSNATSSPYDIDDAPRLLQKQLTSPVQWMNIVEDVKNDVDKYVEFGPDDTLSRIVERLDTDAEVLTAMATRINR